MSPPRTTGTDPQRSEDTADAPVSAASGASRRLRRPYHPPRLVAYGRLTEITRFGGSQVLDSGGGLGQQL